MADCKSCGSPLVGSKCGFCRDLYEKDYRRTYPERRRLYSDMKRAQTPNLTDDQKQEVYRIYNKARALTEATGIQHHVDHIQPISKGGLHVPENLRVVTANENLTKKDKWEGNIVSGIESDQGADLTDEQIMELCTSLASRYKDPNLKDDIIGEGLLACYECKSAGKTKRKDYVGAARRAMNDFVNVKSKAVSIPSTWASRTVSHALSTEEDLEEIEGVRGGTLQLLTAAMRNDTEKVDETMLSVEGAEVDFEEREYQSYLLSKVRKAFSDDEWEFLLLVSDEDTTQAQVADIFGISPQAVSLRLRKLQAKAKHFVTKSDLSDFGK